MRHDIIRLCLGLLVVGCSIVPGPEVGVPGIEGLFYDEAVAIARTQALPKDRFVGAEAGTLGAFDKRKPGRMTAGP